MKNNIIKSIIVATAGHVDHGKTCLIKALTGIDTDRLKEEKKRGITIELGFAYLQNQYGIDIGIIDVPGHEKFVNNMLKGYGSIDLVLFIIALDEGIKQQTIEHFEIVKSLGINNMIIVYTKKDVIENIHQVKNIYDTEAYLNLEKEVNRLAKGTRYEMSKRVCVSAYNGDGIEELKNLILDVAKIDVNRNYDRTMTRLFIDRVFSMDGFGTIVTGSLSEGEISIKDDMMLYPSGEIVKVRNIQSHNNNVEKVFAGQRAAVNLSNVKKDDIKKGEVLAYPNSIFLTDIVTVYIKMFETTERELKNLDSVHFIYGSNEEIGRVLLFDKKTLKNGDEGYATIKFNKKIAIKKEDNFIIRFLSPVTTIGGGEIIDVSGKKYKHNDLNVLNILNTKKDGTLLEKIKIIIDENSDNFIDINSIKILLNKPSDDITILMSKENKFYDVIIDKYDIIRIMDEYKEENYNDFIEYIILGYNDNYISINNFLKVTNYIKDILNKFHNDNPILSGIGKEEFKRYLFKWFRNTDDKLIEKIIDLYFELNIIKISDDKISLKDFNAEITDENLNIKNQIINIYKNSNFEIPKLDWVLNKFDDKKLIKQMINNLNNDNILVKLDYDYYIHKDNLNKALTIAYNYFEKNKEMRMTDFRTALQTSRKYAILFIDYMDKVKITKLEGDKRILLKKVFY